MTAATPETITVSAPVRLDFAGAWSDVAPFATVERGHVVNAALDLRTTVSLRVDQPHYALRSDDLGADCRADTLAALDEGGPLALLTAAVRRAHLAPCALTTSATAPPGSGLGTSGALSVALTHAIAIAQRRRLTPLEVATEAWILETVDAAVPGGRQDQHAAALGGFQSLEYDRGEVRARALHVSTTFAAQLEQQILVCYTGRSRVSGEMIRQVMQAYAAGDAVVVAALRALVDIADEMVTAVEREDIARIGALLNANWTEQQRLAPAMCTPEMRLLEAAMVAAGAIGGKAAGAGGGGSMFFLFPESVPEAGRRAAGPGATILPCRWARDGVRRD
jgi:D-glycero-alpha-D-manno-heptose-7-phosphate kinase